MRALIQTFLFCLMLTQLHAQCQEQDYLALRALYLSTSGDNWTDNTNWPNSTFFVANPTIPAGTDVGTWYGVRTNMNECVDCIDMDGVDNCILTSEGGNNLEGNIPLELGNLSNLTFLNFSYNDLSGSIPWELGNLSNLTYLSLHDNQLNGNIPSELDNLSNLTSLHLSFNELSGNIPPELGNLSNLASLSLYNNQLSGCYDSNVLSLCDQLISYFNNNESISDGNNFDAPWEDFCATQAGICCTTGSLILNISVDNNISCNDGSDGQVTATPSGGTLPYTYTWSASANNQTTATVTILPAGTYTVTVTDANSCAATAQVEIIEPPSLNLTIDINNISCAGGSDGSATATPQGGTPDATGNYTYQWSANTGGQTTAIALNLSAGTYIVTVTDANNCEIFETVSISEPAILSIDNISITDTSCGSANGTATVTASDGILPYTYQWNDANAQTTETAIGLAAGDYNVTLTDMNGCFAIASVNVSDSGTPTAPIATNNGPDCPGGTVILSVTNPVPDAIYTWYSASTNSVLGMGSIVTLFGITMADAGVYYVVAEVSNCTSDLGETTVEVEDCNGPCATEPTIMLPCDDGNVCTTNDSTLVLMSDNSITCEPCEGIENTCDTPGATITLICDDMNPSTINDSITVLICDNNIVCQSCMGVEIQDLVFPGNFDNDAIADGKDLLYWGVAYGYTGPARTNATTDWIPQYNDEDWLTSVNGVNSKHQDANGDGVVNMLDFEILEANYNETYGNNPFIHQPTDMMFVIEALEVDDATNQIRFDLHIASDTPVSTHGISTVIDLSAINYYEVQVDTSDSSLHPDAYIYKDNGGTFDIALTRTDKIDQVIDGPIVSLVVMVKDLHLTTPAININDGYMMSAIGELTSVGGSSLHGRIDAPISLGVNHVYCNDKGSAEVYVSSVPLYSCVWSTGDTTTSINGLDVGSYSVTVNDGMGSVTVIDFDITWAFTPLTISTDSKKIYIDFEETPLSEEVEVSLNGGYSYMPPTTEDMDCLIPNGTYEIFIRRIPNECSTYLADGLVSVPKPPLPDNLNAYLINSLGDTPRLVYELDKNGMVDISLYNTHGQQIHTFHKATSTVGKHEIDVDKSNLPRGIYFIHIRHESDSYIRFKTLKILM